MGSYPSGNSHEYMDAPPAEARKPVPRWPWFAAGLTTPMFAVLLILVSTGSEPAAVPEIDNLVQAAGPTVFASIPRNGYSRFEQGIAEYDVSGDRIRMIVGQGDSLEQMFRRNDLSLRDLSKMVELPDAAYFLRMLSPGNEVVVTHRAGRVQSLQREIDDFKALRIVRHSDSYAVDMVERPVETRAVGAHGVIERSLFAAAQDAGIADRVIMKMAEIFQWDIDFLKDVRVGDEFTVIYEQLWREGEKLKDGEILAAEFNNKGIHYRAARYADKNGAVDYFTAGRAQRTQGIHPCACRLHENQFNIRPQPTASRTQLNPRSSRRRLRRPHGHAGARFGRRPPSAFAAHATASAIPSSLNTAARSPRSTLTCPGLPILASAAVSIRDKPSATSVCPAWLPGPICTTSIR